MFVCFFVCFVCLSVLSLDKLILSVVLFVGLLAVRLVCFCVCFFLSCVEPEGASHGRAIQAARPRSGPCVLAGFLQRSQAQAEAAGHNVPVVGA